METIEKITLNQEKVKGNSTTSFTSTLNSKIGLTNAVSNETVRRFYYTVGQFNILIEADLKVENFTKLSINKVPNIPAYNLGIVSIRGVIMPVIDMHSFLEIKKQNSNSITNNYMMIEHKDYAPIIFRTDNLPSMINLDKFTQSKNLKNTPNWVKRHLNDGNTSLFDIKHSELLLRFTQN